MLDLSQYPDGVVSLCPPRQDAPGVPPDAVHIATEGPIGLAVRRYCTRQRLAFTSSYHTQFAEYVRMRTPIPIKCSYAYLRWFHGLATYTLVGTRSVQQLLLACGLRTWSCGRGASIPICSGRARRASWMRPARLRCIPGRVAVEKNIEAFLALDLPGSKFVVGDGPDLPDLRGRYPAVRFVGWKRGEELASYLAAADVFVFPSRTDTFGLVLLEAMACGVPVAAYPVTGPIDVVVPNRTGFLNEDLRQAVLDALKLDSKACTDHARVFSWRRCAEVFASFLSPAAA